MSKRFTVTLNKARTFAQLSGELRAIKLERYARLAPVSLVLCTLFTVYSELSL